MSQGRSYFFIIILIVIITAISSLKAKDESTGLGIGTRTCADFIHQTVEMSDSGELTDRAMMNRLEYLQWVNGFMTALNIRHYEKNNTFKNMNAVNKFNDLYNKIIISCNYIQEERNNDDFSIAAYIVFDSLALEN